MGVPIGKHLLRVTVDGKRLLHRIERLLDRRGGNARLTEVRPVWLRVVQQSLRLCRQCFGVRAPVCVALTVQKDFPGTSCCLHQVVAAAGQGLKLREPLGGKRRDVPVQFVLCPVFTEDLIPDRRCLASEGDLLEILKFPDERSVSFAIERNT